MAFAVVTAATVGLSAATQCQRLSGERFLYYAKDFGWCAGTDHTLYSHRCMAAEARVLNRTLVYDSRFCNSALHQSKFEYLDNNVEMDYEDPLANHINLTRWEELPAISKDEFLFGESCAHVTGRIPPRKLMLKVPNNATTSELLKYHDVPLLIRSFVPKWPDAKTSRFRWWFSLCETPYGNTGLTSKAAQQVITKQAHSFLQPTESALRMADAVIRRLGRTRFVSVHVRRGDKAQSRAEVDAATQPGRIAEVLSRCRVPPGTAVYIASNEQDPGFFFKRPLSTSYNVYTAGNFTAELRQAIYAEHLMFTVEKLIMMRAAKHFETFFDLLVPKTCGKGRNTQALFLYSRTTYGGGHKRR